MPTLKRQKATSGKREYPGVYFIMGTSAEGKEEKIFYIRYRKNGKMIDEKAGRQFLDKMTPAKASNIRARRMRGDEPTNQERRETEAAQKKREEGKYTIDRLFKEYIKYRTKNKSLSTDKSRYKKHIKSLFGNKEPQEIAPLDVDRLRISLLKKLSPQTVKHILNLLTWIVNFGVKKNLSEGLSFHVSKPTVDNIKIEKLNEDEYSRLLKAIGESDHPFAPNLMLLALYSGLRRGELFKLKWSDIDFHEGFIHLRDPKGKVSQTIPLNDLARNVLESHREKSAKKKSAYVFPGRGGRQRTDINKAVNEIKEAAGLPKDFRPLHGLRHSFASRLASSGEVDMYTLQKLLTHKDFRMTQRYAHLQDSALKRASNVVTEVFSHSTNDQDQDVNQKAG